MSAYRTLDPSIASRQSKKRSRKNTTPSTSTSKKGKNRTLSPIDYSNMTDSALIATVSGKFSSAAAQTAGVAESNEFIPKHHLSDAGEELGQPAVVLCSCSRLRLLQV